MGCRKGGHYRAEHLFIENGDAGSMPAFSFFGTAARHSYKRNKKINLYYFPS
jgi:hypothetical protein